MKRILAYSLLIVFSITLLLPAGSAYEIPDGFGLESKIFLESHLAEWNVTNDYPNVNAIRLSPDSSMLASGSDNGTIKIWRVSSGELITTFKGHTGSVRCIDWSPDGSMVASGSVDNTIRIWDIEPGSVSKTLSGHGQSVNDLRWSEGNRLISCSRNRTDITVGEIRIWDIESEQCSGILSSQVSEILTLDVSPNGTGVSAGSSDGTVSSWNLPSNSSVFEKSAHSRAVASLRYSPDGSLFATSARDNKISVWDAETGERIKTTEGRPIEFGVMGILSLDWSPNGERIVLSYADSSIEIRDSRTLELIQTLRDHVISVQTVDWSHDGKRIASGSNNATIIIWSEDTDLDGFADNNDLFPDNDNEWKDTDGDGIGDNSDVFPENPLEWSDRDRDGYGDNSDLFPDDPGDWKDRDGDGLGDNSDIAPGMHNTLLYTIIFLSIAIPSLSFAGYKTRKKVKERRKYLEDLRNWSVGLGYPGDREMEKGTIKALSTVFSLRKRLADYTPIVDLEQEISKMVDNLQGAVKIYQNLIDMNTRGKKEAKERKEKIQKHLRILTEEIKQLDVLEKKREEHMNSLDQKGKRIISSIKSGGDPDDGDTDVEEMKVRFQRLKNSFERMKEASLLKIEEVPDLPRGAFVPDRKKSKIKSATSIKTRRDESSEDKEEVKDSRPVFHTSEVLIDIDREMMMTGGKVYYAVVIKNNYSNPVTDLEISLHLSDDMVRLCGGSKKVRTLKALNPDTISTMVFKMEPRIDAPVMKDKLTIKGELSFSDPEGNKKKKDIPFKKSALMTPFIKPNPIELEDYKQKVEGFNMESMGCSIQTVSSQFVVKAFNYCNNLYPVKSEKIRLRSNETVHLYLLSGRSTAKDMEYLCTILIRKNTKEDTTEVALSGYAPTNKEEIELFIGEVMDTLHYEVLTDKRIKMRGSVESFDPDYLTGKMDHYHLS